MRLRRLFLLGLIGFISQSAWSDVKLWIPSEDHGRIGFIDHSGSLVIKPVFYGAGDFAANGLAPVAMAPATPDHPQLDKWGYINTKGEIVILAQFDRAGEFGDNGLALVRRHDSSLDFIDSAGKFRTSQHFNVMHASDGSGNTFGPVAFSEGLALAGTIDKWGYVDTSGQWAIPSRYGNAHLFAEDGLAVVYQDGHWEYIDTKGRIVMRLAPTLEAPGNFAHSGLASVKQGAACGYINRRGEIVIPAKFDRCGDFGVDTPAGLALVYKMNKVGLIDFKGNFVLQPLSTEKFERDLVFSNGLAAYAPIPAWRRLWGYMDTQGNIKIRPQFLYAGKFADNGLARIITAEHKSGFIDAKGAFVVSADLDCAYDFTPDGLARARRNGQWGFIDAKGNMVVHSQYQPVSDFSRSGYARISAKPTIPKIGSVHFEKSEISCDPQTDSLRLGI